MENEISTKKTLEVFPDVIDKFYSDRLRVQKNCDRERVSLIGPYSAQSGNKACNRNLPLYRRIEKFSEHLQDAAMEIDRKSWEAACLWLRMSRSFCYDSCAFFSPFDRHKKVSRNRALNEIAAWEAGFDHQCSLSTNAKAVASSYAHLVNKTFNSSYDPRVDGPMEYPFRHMGLAHMYIVKDMDERMEIMEWMDERPQYRRIQKFSDFMINWIAGYNAKYGEKYRVIEVHGCVIKVINLATTKSADVRAGDGEEDDNA